MGNSTYYPEGNYPQPREGILPTRIILYLMRLDALLLLRREPQDNVANKSSPSFYMKHLIDLCALCLSLGKINHGFSQKSEAREKDSFGSFSVRAVLPAAKNLFTYAVDENLFFEFYGCSSEYAKLDALKAIWSRKLAPKNAKPVKEELVIGNSAFSARPSPSRT